MVEKTPHGSEPGAEETDDGSPHPLPIEDVLDLHAFHPSDVEDLVAEYLREARARGFRLVRIVHGRGIGVVREMVRAALSRHPDVISYDDAEPEHGGWGATVVRLRPL